MGGTMSCTARHARNPAAGMCTLLRFWCSVFDLQKRALGSGTGAFFSLLTACESPSPAMPTTAHPPGLLPGSRNTTGAPALHFTKNLA